MKKIKITINTKTKKYSIFIGSGILKHSANILKINKIKIKKCLIVVDREVPKKNLSILKKQIKSKNVVVYYFISNEKNKNFKSINIILLGGSALQTYARLTIGRSENAKMPYAM